MNRETVLGYIVEGPKTSREIAEAEGFTSDKEVTKVSRICGRLRDKGVLEDKNEDKRKALWDLTEFGEQFYRLVIVNRWWCEHCGEFVDAVEKPSCVRCGNPVERSL